MRDFRSVLLMVIFLSDTFAVAPVIISIVLYFIYLHLATISRMKIWYRRKHTNLPNMVLVHQSLA